MTLTVTDLFCGAGGSSQGAEEAGTQLALGLNHWRRAINTHSANFPHAEHDCADVSVCDPRYYPTTDLLIASPECFPAGTLILTSRGPVPIEEVAVGDLVLTHRGRWRAVTTTVTTTKPTVIARGHGHYGLETTPEHPIWSRRGYRKWDNSIRQYRREWDAPAWSPVVGMDPASGDGVWWATPTTAHPLPVPPIPGRGMDLARPEFWWLVGRWLGDGSVRIRERSSEITIACGNHEADDLQLRLDSWTPASARCGFDELRWRRRKVRTATLFETGHDELARWLVTHFGRHAYGKTIPGWALTLDGKHRDALLEGYLSADGETNDRGHRAQTASKRLAIGVRLLAESLGHRVSLGHYDDQRNVIEGRTVKVRPYYVVRWLHKEQRAWTTTTEQHAWSRIREIKDGRQCTTVYNLSVAEDESYVAEGIVVHNCTAHSYANGVSRKLARRSLLEVPDPAAERSRATMWDVVRFMEAHRYQAVIVENVINVRDWELFEAWLHAVRSVRPGYHAETVYLNSMVAWPTP
jgi:C-5 cytosine-specific DNA methylase/Hint domain